MDEWSGIEEILMNADYHDQATRYFQRFVVGLATDCDVDKNGFIDLPEDIYSLIEEGSEAPETNRMKKSVLCNRF